MQGRLRAALQLDNVMKIRRAAVLLGLLAVSFALYGCQPGDEAEEFDPASVKLEGSPDPRFVGTWESTKGAAYTFKEDGSYSLRSSVKAQQGSFDIKVDAEWRLNGDKLLVEDAGKLVVPYSYKLEGTTLTLTSLGSSKMQTVLKKKS